MDQPPSLPPYSPFADWLSKFQTAPEPIQALWLFTLTAVVVTFCWSLTAPLRLWLARRERNRWQGDRGRPEGELVLGVYREPGGRLIVYADGQARELDAASAARFEQRQRIMRKW